MGMEAIRGAPPNTGGGVNGQKGRRSERFVHFQMPLHYPRYSKSDYETMPEWKLDCLLSEYGLHVTDNLEEKRKFAMGAFLWSL